MIIGLWDRLRKNTTEVLEEARTDADIADGLRRLIDEKAKTPEGRRLLLQYAAAYVRSKAQNTTLQNVAHIMQLVSEQGCPAQEST
jgi:hypothetical protein